MHRKALLEHWLSKPAIEITRSGMIHRISSFDIEWWTEEKPSYGPVREVGGGSKISNLIVATKALDSLHQVDKLRAYLDGGSTVAFVQNGINKMWPPYGLSYNANRYSPHGHPNWLACVTTHGVYSLGPFASVHASRAGVSVGSVLLNPATPGASDFLVSQLAASPDLCAQKVSRSALWVLQLEKLVVNSVINPLTAVLRCKNGQIFGTAGGALDQVINLLLEEASEVLQALIRDRSVSEIVQGSGSPGWHKSSGSSCTLLRA